MGWLPWLPLSCGLSALVSAAARPSRYAGFEVAAPARRCPAPSPGSRRRSRRRLRVNATPAPHDARMTMPTTTTTTSDELPPSPPPPPPPLLPAPPPASSPPSRVPAADGGSPGLPNVGTAVGPGGASGTVGCTVVGGAGADGAAVMTPVGAAVAGTVAGASVVGASVVGVGVVGGGAIPNAYDVEFCHARVGCSRQTMRRALLGWPGTRASGVAWDEK